ncbi:hypothetical protein BU24DRAFT_82445 [Aaosphaeria arxii CBS 175.79]|uniref:Uncharacterized protein n=1 Tax=Aaosphaeria arxii CBS 175.79 TaxID=1450172 RepID=A0A6A5X8B3_9PLEO|nr:uncharacterized protein BU24DRAFT_82445 [Aaosphaeria arxii CBS 175.79]KAF2009151.1 hypothetical protein BU24DRAFT_82445 [Aaosphaeria arxii CBS 175.79]
MDEHSIPGWKSPLITSDHVENIQESQLDGETIDGQTPSRQHDNGCNRTPFQFLRKFGILHLSFLLVALGAGIAIGSTIGRRRVPLGLYLLFAATATLWVVLSSYATFADARRTSSLPPERTALLGRFRGRTFFGRFNTLFCHLLIIATLIGAGIPLCISVQHNKLPLGLLVVETFGMIVWAIFSRLNQDREASQV